jgi:hypothetical protein
MSPSAKQIEKGEPFETASGKIEIFSTYLAGIKDWKKTQFGYEIPYHPEVDRALRIPQSPEAQKYPFHLITPHPRWRTHSIFNNIAWLRETYEQEVTINASDAAKLGIKTGDTVEVWNDRGKCVVPVYVTERCMPGVVVLFEGAWMDLDKNGVDRAGNPDFLTLDEPSPAGAFAYNTAWSHQEDRSGPSPGLGRAGRRARPCSAATCKLRGTLPWPRKSSSANSATPRKPRARSPEAARRHDLRRRWCPACSSGSSTTTSTASAAAPARSPARTRTACPRARASVASCTSRAAATRTCSPTR